MGIRNSLVRRIISLLFFFVLPLSLQARIQIGDIEVESLDELFNKENSSFWGEFGVFKKADSEFWIADMPSMLMNVGDEKAIILAFNEELNQDSVRSVLIYQLNEQFGKFEEKRIPYPKDPISYEWHRKENGKQYIFSISKDKKVGTLNIFQR